MNRTQKILATCAVVTFYSTVLLGMDTRPTEFLYDCGVAAVFAFAGALLISFIWS